jgi:circadian clock protein KaiB
MKGEMEESKKFIFRLFVTGTSPNSAKAILNTQKICKDYLENNFELEIIDIYQQPELAQPEQLYGAPLLIKKLPLPERRFIGDMSDTKKILSGLGLGQELK